MQNAWHDYDWAKCGLKFEVHGFPCMDNSPHYGILRLTHGCHGQSC